MQRALKECARAERDLTADPVHDLRVTLRRCRSLASGLAEVDSDPAWRDMRRESRKLFRRLGALRDMQVQIEWLQKLAPADDPVRQILLDQIASRENELRAETTQVLEAFDGKKWQAWSRVLPERARRLPADGLVAQHLALERLEEARAMHRRALRNRNPAAWHELRIGLKRFRYTVENFLPERYAAWGKDLKHLQDMLGEVHDLDVLRNTLPEAGPVFDAAAQDRWHGWIERERQSRLDEYRKEMAGHGSLWTVWRAGLPSGAHLEAAALAKLTAWAAYLDPDVGHSRHVSRLALNLFDGLAVAGRNGPFSSPRSRRLLHAAALLHNAGRSEGKKGAHKATYRLISRLDAPAGWTAEEMKRVALIARYYRGAEPREGHKGFAELDPNEQKTITCLAAVLRLAEGLDCAHDSAVEGITVSNGGGFVLLEAEGWEENQENAAEIGGRKHLLERALGLPVIVRSAERAISPAVPQAAAPALEIVTRNGTNR